MEKVINITANHNQVSQEIKGILTEKLTQAGYTVPEEFDPAAELIFCVGGDGALLRTLRYYHFPQIPIIGVNTGHLGFFQELMPDQLDDFIRDYEEGNYVVQTMKVAQAEVHTRNETVKLQGLNEIIIKADKSRSIHLNMSLGSNFVEKFSGDGILVATPAGSTAYNYALGGCIVDPRVDLLQITPLAPMNTTAFRSFTSSVVVPPDITINIVPEFTYENSLLVVADGKEYNFEDITGISVSFSDKTVQLLRLNGYDFWDKVKTKFL